MGACVILKDHFFSFANSTAWRELILVCLPTPLLHTRSLCVCSTLENEGRPWHTITTKHIPFCPTAPSGQTQTCGPHVYQASKSKTADLRLLVPFTIHFIVNHSEKKKIWSADFLFGTLAFLINISWTQPNQDLPSQVSRGLPWWAFVGFIGETFDKIR